MSALRYAVLAVACFLMLFPILWMVNGSLQPYSNMVKMPPSIFPANPTLTAYAELLLIPPPGTRLYVPDIKHIWQPIKWAANTTKILVIDIIVCTIISLMAGYCFSVYEWRGKKFIYLLYVMGMVAPPVTLISTFIIMHRLGLYGTHWAMILPATYNAAIMYLIKVHIDTIPRELIEAARLEGAGETRILLRLMLPLCKAPIGVGIVIITRNVLKGYIWGTIVLPDRDKQTLMVGLMEVTTRAVSTPSGNAVGVMLAAGVVNFVPLLIVFLFCQKQLMYGIKVGGVRG